MGLIRICYRSWNGSRNGFSNYGLDAALTIGGRLIVGAGTEVATEINEEQDLDPLSIVIAGITNIPSYLLGMKPGTFMGNSLTSINNLKFIGQQIFGTNANNYLQNVFKNGADNGNKATVSSSVSSSGSRGGTSTLGSNSIQQVIKSTGGSTLKNPQQKAASEALASKIIAKQRAANKK